MIGKYRAVYEALGLDERLWRAATGEIDLRLMDLSIEYPFETFGLTPALIPIYNIGGNENWGVWKHWFVARRTSIAFWNAESDCAVEYARSADQFFALLAVVYASGEPEVLRPDLRPFAFVAKIPNLEEIVERVRRWNGFDYPLLRELPQFSKDAPLGCFAPDERFMYNGEFASLATPLDREHLGRLCSFELPEAGFGRERFTEHPAAPPWFKVKEQKDLFCSLLRAGDLGRAWLSLNSTGWSIPDARRAMNALDEAARDPKFHLLNQAWQAIPHETLGGY